MLVVEDVDTTRRRMCAALRANGYQVDEASDGIEGMRMLAASPGFDAILLDLLLPQLDGWHFREAQLRQPQLARIPTIIVTVRPLRESDRYSLHAQSVIQKPFEDDTLITTVANACAARADTPATARPAARRAPAMSPDKELFWSRRGAVACGLHAPAPGSEQWASERWAAIPAGAGRDRLIYQCQHCSGRGPINHRTLASASR